MNVTKGKKVILLFVVTLLLASLACSVGGGSADPTPTAEVEKLIRPTDTQAPTSPPPTAAPAPTQGSPASTGGGYSDFVTVYDDFSVLTVEVPAAWTDVDGRAWAFDGEQIGASIWAATSVDGLSNNWTTPGLFFNVSNRTDLIGSASQFLEEKKSFFSSNCTYEGRTIYEDAAFIGSMDRYSNCAGAGSSYVVVVAEPKNSTENYLVDLEVQLASPADEQTLTRILETFNVIGSMGDLSGAAGGYTTVTDDYNSIQVDIPSEWSDVDGGYWEMDGDVIGSMISASADLNSFLSTWDEPGMKFGVSDDLVDRFGGIVMMLDAWKYGLVDECEFTGRYDYLDALYEGKYDEYKNCGGPGGPFYAVFSTRPINNPLAYNIIVEIQYNNDEDLDDVWQILDTFQVIGNLP